MRGGNVVVDDDDCIYDDELYPKETLTPRTLETPPTIIIDPTPRGLTQGRGTKILPQMKLLQRLPILFGQVKTGNTSENLLNQIRQIVCSLY